MADYYYDYGTTSYTTYTTCTTTTGCTTIYDGYSYTTTGSTTYIPYSWYVIGAQGQWIPYVPTQAEVRQPTAEEVAQAAAAQAAETERRTAEKANRETAIQRGEQLLKDVLGEADYALFKANGYVDVPSRKDANMRYRIRANRRIGIVKLEDGQWREKALSLCIHPESYWQYVAGDQIAAHALLAKFDEPTLNAVANVHKMAA